LAQAKAGSLADLVVKKGSKMRSSVPASIPEPLSENRDQNILARRDRLGQIRDISLVERSISRLNRQLAAFGHRVSRIHRKIQQRVFQLPGVCLSFPKAGGGNCFKRDCLSQSALQQIGYPGD
jgi:hypothetical protein